MVLDFLTTNEELLLVHKDMSQITTVKKYDLMLTPQFYISKKESLPVRYKFQAIKLASSILDELTEDTNYSYTAIQEDNGWTLIAYDMQEIESFMESKGLPKHLINKIYFAQQAKEHFSHAISINDTMVMTTIDDVVVMIPKSIADVKELGTFTHEFRPDNTIISPQTRSSLVSPKQAIAVSVCLFILSTIYFFEGMKYQNEISNIEAKLERSKKKYPKLQGKSNIVLNNLYKSNYAIDSVQRKIRDHLKKISMLVGKKAKLNSLKITQQKYEAIIAVDQKNLSKLKEYAKSINLHIANSNGNLVLSGAL